MHAAEGILTARGGMTSHAAVVARGWGKPCVCGCEALRVDNGSKTATLGGEALKQGDWISVNGSTGEVLRGKQELKPPELAGVCGGGGGGDGGVHGAGRLDAPSTLRTPPRQATWPSSCPGWTSSARLACGPTQTRPQMLP